MNSFFSLERASHGSFEYFTVKSAAIGHRVDLTVYKPKGDFDKLPVVILLHGVYGSHWAWSLKGQVHEVLENGIKSGDLPAMMLVMPSDGLFQDGSTYMKHYNADYESWIVNEIPELIRDQFQEVDSTSPFFITGLSMGGYGAMSLGAKNPQVFSAFSGLSSITNFDDIAPFVEDFESLKSSIISPEDLSEILVKNRVNLKPFRFDCGIEDVLFPSNLALHEFLEKEQIAHEFFSYPGTHDWEYWKKNIRATLQFFAQSI